MAPRPPFTLLRALHHPHIRLKPPAPRHPAQIPNRALPRSASSSAYAKTVEGATDISHSAFISSASPDSNFNPLQTPTAGQDTLADDRRGHLSPTNSHLFKLILPLPTSLTAYKPPAQPTAFLLHPSQPLSHLSRLISGSLPPSERNVEITYLALTGPEESIDSHLRNAEEEEGVADRSEGGPFLGERSSRDGKWQEVSWSSSTDLSDFIKQSCLNERFKINIKPESPSEGKGGEEGRAATEVEKEGLTMEVVIPSFASRTTYLRARLLKLTKELDQTTKQKKA